MDASATTQTTNQENQEDQRPVQNPAHPTNPGHRRSIDPVELRAWLWLLAGLVAVILLLVTGALYVRVQAQPDSFAGVVAGADGAVYLRTHPHPSSSVVTLLNPGTPLQVRDSRDAEGNRWYEVRTERGHGWLPAERVERRD